MGTSSLFGLAHSLARGNILTFFNTALPGSQKASSLIRLSTSTYRVSRQDSKAHLGINPTEPVLQNQMWHYSISIETEKHLT